MNNRANGKMHQRLVVVHVLVVSLLVALAARLWYVQVLSGTEFARAAVQNQSREIVVPAIRGDILDSAGRPLVRNRTTLVVSVDRTLLAQQPDGGTAVLRRLAKVLGKSHRDIANRVRLCAPGVKRPCWPGSPYQPIPVAERVAERRALQIAERQEDFPGVTAQLAGVRDYPEPGGANASQVLGYLQPVTQQELEKRTSLQTTFSGVDLVGRDGLEAVYDESLRGAPGVRQVAVDRTGRVLATVRQQASRPGDVLVTSLDARVQGVVERALKGAVKGARQQGKPADSAAGVVLDVRTGRVIALASWPTYDPAVWTGGISESAYDALLSKNRGLPLISRATQGQFAPGSTFKISSTMAAVRDGYSFRGSYSCPGSFRVGNRYFRNFEGRAQGSMNLHRALVVSCDTIYYRFGYQMWLADGGMDPVSKPKDRMSRMARAFGFGAPTGIDLPHEAAGRIPDRTWKRQFWEQTRAYNCKQAKTGFPEVARHSPARARYLTQLARESCVDGYVYRAGDAANFAIGQGDVLVTPLQLARAYAAIANGGKVFSPRIARALVRPDGTVVREITPPVVGRLPVSRKAIGYVRRALADVPRAGTARGAFAGFPLSQVPVAGKTGTAEVYGKEDTSWFASFAPANKPRIAVVVMVSQAGFGASAAAPAVREIYEGIFGVGRGSAALPGGKPPTKLPKVGKMPAQQTAMTQDHGSTPSDPPSAPAPSTPAPRAGGRR